MRVLFLHQSWAWGLLALHCRLEVRYSDHHVDCWVYPLLEGSPGRSPRALARDLGPHCCQSAGLEGDGHRHEQRGSRVGFAKSRGRAGRPSASRGWLSGLTRGLAGLTRLAQGKRHSWRSSCCEPARGTVGRLVPRAASGAGLSAGASQGCATLVCMLSLHYAI